MAGILTSHSGLRPEAKRYVMAGRGVVVDIAGRGDFVTIQDAVDYIAARDIGGRIWIRSGTYNESVTVDHSPLVIEGEAWDTLVDGGTIGHAFDVTAGGTTQRVVIQHLEAKTTAGAGNSYHSFYLQPGASFSLINDILVNESDGVCVGSDTGANSVEIRNCYLSNADGNGITPRTRWSIVGNIITLNGNNGIGANTGVSDSMVCVGNLIMSNSGNGVYIGADDENCLVVGNRASGNTSSEITDDSGTGTVTGNDTS